MLLPPLVWATFSNSATFSGAAMAQEFQVEDEAELLATIEQASKEAIAKAEKSVVALARVPMDRAPTDRTQGSLLLTLPPQLDDPLSDPNFVPTFYGTGVIVSKEGHIVTCAHVLDDPAKNRYYVWLNKQAYRARVVTGRTLAADAFSDIALLKIEASDDLVPIELYEEGDVQKGQLVVAIGNPDAIARDGKASASWGIISNLNRFAPAERSGDGTPDRKQTLHEYGTLLQSDAATVLHCSGGALVNLKGQMIGLTTALSAKPDLRSPAGFAIPVDKLFRRTIEKLKQGKLPEYGFLGIEPADLPIQERMRGLQGARVSTVIAGLPGDLAGLRSGDIILSVDEEPIQNSVDLFRELSRAEAGKLVSLELDRPNYGAESSYRRMQLEATVSKKYVATARPSYSREPRPSRRGMMVEYVTAIPAAPAQLQAFYYRGGKRPKIAVLEVDPDSAAWHAGLRPGLAIHSVEGKPVESPTEFYQAVPQEGEIRIAFFDHRGMLQRITFGE